MSFAAFVLSTGRCGTQWLAAALSDLYPERIAVEHEPLQSGYEARKTLAHVSSGKSLEALPADVLHHLEGVAERLATRPYLECGHPSWSTIPYLAQRFGSRLRVLHLIRHPVPTCFSWLTHFAFQKQLLPHLPEKVLLSPFDEGTKFTEYRDVWDALTPYEKCLFYWTEVQAFALEQQENLRVPWLRMRYEDLFTQQGFSEVVRFLGLPLSEDRLRFSSRRVDKFRYLSPVWQDWRIIRRHPRAVSVARALGYDVEAVDDAQLVRRYLHGDPDTGG